MILESGSFNALSGALCDAFPSESELALVVRCLNTRLRDITKDDTLPAMVLNLIEYAESRDTIEELLRCAKQQNTTNRALARLELADLEEAPSTDQVLKAGGGGTKFKQGLKEALANLDSAGMQLVAAQDLSALLTGASEKEANTLYLALLGNVKVDRPSAVVTALAPIIAAYLQRRIGSGKRPDDVNLDLARARLRRIDLSGLDLHEADVAFADLRYAKLENANLWRSRGYAVDVTKAGLSRSNLEEARWHSAVASKARFHDCRMVSIVLKEADLTGAEFHQSRLQGAHFERADLSGAGFEQADLSDAFFTDAKIDDDAAASISRALNWDKAHFDAATLALISEKAGH